MKPTGVLITGGGGFIGSHLAEYYLGNGVPVVCVDNFSTGSRSHVEFLRKVPGGEKLVFIEADVVQPWEWSSRLDQDLRQSISHIFHLASPASPPLYQNLAFDTLWVNSLGLKNALEWADRHKSRVIFASTSEVYGDPKCDPQPESYWGNVNSFGVRACYDEAKRFGEALLYTHNWKNKTRHGLVRIFNTYGPRMNPHDGRVIINFLVQAAKGQNLTVYGDGHQTRSFCYVSDLVSGMVRYAEGEFTEPVNLGNDREFSILELAEEVKRVFAEKKFELEFLPLPQDDPRQRRPDLTRAKSCLAPWVPQVSLLDGLRRTKAWLEQ